MPTSRQLRRERREAERKALKAEYQAAKAQAHLQAEAEPQPEITIEPRSRAEINRANSQHSTGPRSFIGKQRSSKNGFKHGLYSKQLIIPGEDPAELDHLKADLVAEHQPANQTEHILVNEIAEHFWRLRRMRALEARAFTPENLDSWLECGLLPLIQRSMASAERGLHKALTQLRQIRRNRETGTEACLPTRGLARRGASPSHSQPEIGFVSQKQESGDDSGFVPPFSFSTSLQDHDPDEFGPDLTPLLPPEHEILSEEPPAAA